MISIMGNVCLLSAEKKRAIPHFITETGTIKDGYINIRWRSNDNSAIYELQQAADSLFKTSRTIYRGQDLASFISGLKDGNYYYRIRDTRLPLWSKPLKITVQHHSMALATWLFCTGFIVFSITSGVIIWGNRDTQRVS